MVQSEALTGTGLEGLRKITDRAVPWQPSLLHIHTHSQSSECDDPTELLTHFTALLITSAHRKPIIHLFT
jgi:hypothetical protein